MTFDDVTATLTAALVGSVHRQHVTIHTYFRYNSDRYRYTECVEPQNVTALGCMASARVPFTPPPRASARAVDERPSPELRAPHGHRCARSTELRTWDRKRGLGTQRVHTHYTLHTTVERLSGIE